MINIAIVDDRQLTRKALSDHLVSFGYNVLFEATDGGNLIEQLKPGNIPHIVLLDIKMPVMDGFETAKWLRKNYPGLIVIALGILDDQQDIITMLSYGARAFLFKYADPRILKTAIQTIINEGYYLSNLVRYERIYNSNLLDDDGGKSAGYAIRMNDRELEFLKYACTELTYKEIAAKMFVSPRTIDNYRESLFEKLNVRSRIGLCVYAIKNKIVEL